MLRMDVAETARKRAEEVIISKAFDTGYYLYDYTIGVKKWFTYVCPDCRKIINMTDQEAKSFITQGERWYNHNVTCPDCGKVNATTSRTLERGCVYTEIDDSKIVTAKCTISTYPEVEFITECELENFTSKDLYENIEASKSKNYSVELSDESNWDRIYKKILTMDAGLKDADSIKAFLDDIASHSSRTNLLSYLLIKENANIWKVITNVNNQETRGIIKRFFNDFVQDDCKHANFTALKGVFKKEKELTDDDISEGEVFIMPRECTNKCMSLAQFSAVKKLFSKSKNVDDFNKIMDGAISDSPKYINALRNTLKVTNLTSEKIANICIYQYIFSGRDFVKTCKLIASLGNKINKLVYDRNDLYGAEWCEKSNKWTFSGLDTDSLRRRELSTRVANHKPECEFVFDGVDMYEFESDIDNIKSMTENESLYFAAIIDLYEKDIAYFFTSKINSKYVYATRTGSVLLSGELKRSIKKGCLNCKDVATCPNAYKSVARNCQSYDNKAVSENGDFTVVGYDKDYDEFITYSHYKLLSDAIATAKELAASVKEDLLLGNSGEPIDYIEVYSDWNKDTEEKVWGSYSQIEERA